MRQQLHLHKVRPPLFRPLTAQAPPKDEIPQSVRFLRSHLAASNKGLCLLSSFVPHLSWCFRFVKPQPDKARRLPTRLSAAHAPQTKPNSSSGTFFSASFHLQHQCCTHTHFFFSTPFAPPFIVKIMFMCSPGATYLPTRHITQTKSNRSVPPHLCISPHRQQQAYKGTDT